MTNTNLITTLASAAAITDEAIDGIAKIHVDIDEVSIVRSKLDKLRRRSAHTKMKWIGMLVGKSHVGKTRSVEEYIRGGRDERTPEGRKVDYVLVKLTHGTTNETSLARQILVALGDQLAVRSSPEDLMPRLIHFLKEMEVKLLILDEFQSMVNGKSDQIVYSTADWLKSLADADTCPILIIGTPNLPKRLLKNLQFQNRTLWTHQVEAMPMNSMDDLEYFRSFILAFMDWSTIKLAFEVTDELVLRFHFATSGHVGRFGKMLLISAADEAQQDGKRLIELKHLAAAWADNAFTAEEDGETWDRVADQDGRVLNPFLMSLPLLVEAMRRGRAEWFLTNVGEG